MREDVQVVDLPSVFERVCVEMGAMYKNMHGWTHEEVMETVDLMCKEFKGTVDSFEEYVRNDDAEGLMALAKQEGTKRLLKATRAGVIQCRAI